jgi:hypothetical protein
MNELCNTTNQAAKIRKTLFTTASALAFAAYGGNAQAADNDRPTVWIEGGWHFESVTGESDPFVPPLDAYNRANGLASFVTLEQQLGRTYGGEGSISFQPKGSDWVLTVSGRYGRVHTVRRFLDKKAISAPGPLKDWIRGTIIPTTNLYAEGSVSNSESHAILDFQVGKDIGIGFLGHGTDSIISFGARYAQMSAKSKGNIDAHPDAVFEQRTINILGNQKYRIYTPGHGSVSSENRADSLRALGPSISMKNTTGLLGTVDDGQLALDWGVNAAVLFGRQKANISHQSTVIIKNGHYTGAVIPYPHVTRSRSRTVTIPNIGGFAGLSFRFINAKISAGYRADFFFGAKDSGLDTRNTSDVGFHGPYATISIGLGG